MCQAKVTMIFLKLSTLSVVRFFFNQLCICHFLIFGTLEIFDICILLQYVIFKDDEDIPTSPKQAYIHNSGIKLTKDEVIMNNVDSSDGNLEKEFFGKYDNIHVHIKFHHINLYFLF